jgi:ribosome-associated protein
VKGNSRLTAEKLVKLCRDIALAKKAEDAIILDVRNVSSVADFFLICTGTSEPHLKAIADEITRRVRDEGIRPRHRDGFPASRWVVMDFNDVLVHIFHPELRQRYTLEDLWGDAKRVK